MAKVRTFTQVFPAGHPRAGEDTFFIEKVLKSFTVLGIPVLEIDAMRYFDNEVWESCEPKYHTIRAGHHFKPGDKFSPRVWSGRPYNSQQIILAPDVEIKKTWNFEVRRGEYYLNGTKLFFMLERLAGNDGLSKEDFYGWFKKPFDGQIICWNEKIEY